MISSWYVFRDALCSCRSIFFIDQVFFVVSHRYLASNSGENIFLLRVFSKSIFFSISNSLTVFVVFAGQLRHVGPGADDALFFFSSGVMC